MAFPATINTLDQALTDLRGSMLRARNIVSELRTQSEINPTQRILYVKLLRTLSKEIGIWDSLATVPGIAAYAQEQYQDSGIDLATEYAAMKAAAINLQTWINTNLPTDAGSGAALLEVIQEDGTSIPLTFSTAGAASFRTEADAFLATIS